MIEWSTWLGFAVGLTAGFLHAAMLWRAVHRVTAWTPLMGMLRLVGVAGILVTAALAGLILSAAAGWAIGLATLGTWFHVSRANHATAAATNRSNE